MKVVVLGGGNSPERDISLKSATAVNKALIKAGLETVQHDSANGLGLLADLKDAIVFPILHGAGGEDGTLQSSLERIGLPYLGSDSKASAICFDKHLTRQALLTGNLPIAKGDKVTQETYQTHELKSVPHVLKVNRGGSSIGTYIVRDPKNLDDQKVKEVFSLDKQAVIEELIEGVEITVPILDNKALPVIEIVPPADQEFDYENKYNGKTKELCPPASINEQTQLKAQQLAEKVHKTLGARHLSRVDIIAKSNGDLIVLELNTIPGMTEQSLYPLSAKTAGISMSELMKKFVDLVKRDYGINE